jgi:cyclic beta-1,2-glucan synthetase
LRTARDHAELAIGFPRSRPGVLGEGDKAAALFWMLNPINHARTRADTHRYKVEPYVVVADVYAASGHVGRGGWTWYTGSAGWMQRAGVESILGLRIESDKLRLDPCIPASWPRFEITLRHGASRFEIVVENPGRDAGRRQRRARWRLDR